MHQNLNDMFVGELVGPLLAGLPLATGGERSSVVYTRQITQLPTLCVVGGGVSADTVTRWRLCRRVESQKMVK